MRRRAKKKKISRTSLLKRSPFKGETIAFENKFNAKERRGEVKIIAVDANGKRRKIGNFGYEKKYKDGKKTITPYLFNIKNEYENYRDLGLMGNAVLYATESHGLKPSSVSKKASTTLQPLGKQFLKKYFEKIKNIDEAKEHYTFKPKEISEITLKEIEKLPAEKAHETLQKIKNRELRIRSKDADKIKGLLEKKVINLHFKK